MFLFRASVSSLNWINSFCRGRKTEETIRNIIAASHKQPPRSVLTLVTVEPCLNGHLFQIVFLVPALIFSPELTFLTFLLVPLVSIIWQYLTSKVILSLHTQCLPWRAWLLNILWASIVYEVIKTFEAHSTKLVIFTLVSNKWSRITIMLFY